MTAEPVVDAASPSMSSDRRRRGWRIARDALSIILIAAPIIVMSPPRITQTGGGLDFSWMLGLNLAVTRHLRFGSAINYTYGPLGFLLYPFPGAHVWVATGFWLIVDALLVWQIVRALPERGRLFAAALFCVLWSGAEAAGLWPEYRLLLLLAVLELAMLKRPTKSMGALVGGTAAVGIFVKFTVGIAMLLAVGVLLIVAIIRRDRRYVPAVLWGIVAALVVSAGVIAWFMGSLHALTQWLHASLDLSTGYGVGLSQPVARGVLWATLVAVLVSIAALGIAWRKGARDAALLGLTLVPGLAIVFKHGYIRHGGLLVFPFLFATWGLASARMRPSRALLGFGASLVVLGCTASAWHTCGKAAGAECWKHFGSSFKAAGVPVAIDTVNRGWDKGADPAWIASDRLPSSMIREIDARPGATVDVVPWEIGMVAANDLSWAPNKIIQTYQAYTVFLDRLSAASYMGPSAAQFVVFRFFPFDDRHPVLEAPDTLRTLMSNYRVVQANLVRGLFLFERWQPTPSPRAAIAYQETADIGGWISVPDGVRAPMLRADFRLSPLGALQELAADIPEVDVEIEYASGRSARYRITPDLFREGVPIGMVPYLRSGSFRDWLAGRFGDHVVRIRFLGPGLRAYRSVLKVQWLTS